MIREEHRIMVMIMTATHRTFLTSSSASVIFSFVIWYTSSVAWTRKVCDMTPTLATVPLHISTEQIIHRLYTPQSQYSRDEVAVPAFETIKHHLLTSHTSYEHWAQNWSRCTSSQPAGNFESHPPCHYFLQGLWSSFQPSPSFDQAVAQVILLGDRGM